MNGGPEPADRAGDAEARAAFLLRLRAAGIRDLAVLRAMEAVPRAAFVAPAHAALALRDVALPIACGQSVPEPILVARLLAGSRLDPSMRVLLVGLGSGYTASVLSCLVGGVVAVDRFRTLVDAAADRLAVLARAPVLCRWADGLDLPDEVPYDRVVLMGAAATVPARLWALVKPGGAVLHARGAFDGQGAGQVLVMAERRDDGIVKQTIIGPCRLAPLRAGRAAAL